MNDNIWLNKHSSSIINPKCRFVCFPHAGGNSSFFRNWSIKLSSIEVWSICYPGRAARINESQFEDLKTLSMNIATALEKLTEFPLVFFGHSMGVAVALETIRILEHKGINIEHFFASGSRNGKCPTQSTYIEEDNETLFNNLIEMGGTDPNTITDPIFQEIVLPSIRADAKMFHNYKMNIKPKLNCPITTIVGIEDNHSDIRPWSELTLNDFKEYVVPGNHFYLITNPPISIIKNQLNKFYVSK